MNKKITLAGLLVLGLITLSLTPVSAQSGIRIGNIADGCGPGHRAGGWLNCNGSSANQNRALSQYLAMFGDWFGLDFLFAGNVLEPGLELDTNEDGAPDIVIAPVLKNGVINGIGRDNANGRPAIPLH